MSDDEAPDRLAHRLKPRLAHRSTHHLPNLLPEDGELYYCADWLTSARAQHYFEALNSEIHWQQDPVKMFGKVLIPQRKIAWHGSEPFTYTYSGHTKIAQPWTLTLKDLLAALRTTCGEDFNSCLLNLYPTGSAGMGWHSDDEPELVPQSTIASVSLGATRTFHLKHRHHGTRVSLELAPGSLLLMQGSIQRHWQHRLAPTRKTDAPRINLTFRHMRSPS